MQQPSTMISKRGHMATYYSAKIFEIWQHFQKLIDPPSRMPNGNFGTNCGKKDLKQMYVCGLNGFFCKKLIMLKFQIS